MRILLDEDTPAPLWRHLIGHEVTTVPREGRSGIKNGRLLDLIAEHRFDLLITCDRNMQYQQTVTGRPFAVIVLVVPNKRMQTILPLIPELNTLLLTIQSGHIHQIPAGQSVE